jgi:hypothetical protein
MTRWLVLLVAVALVAAAISLPLLPSHRGGGPTADLVRTTRDPDECSTLWNRQASAAAHAELGALAASVAEQKVSAGLAGPALGASQVCFMAYGDGTTTTLWVYAPEGWKRLKHPRDPALRSMKNAVYNVSSGTARQDGTVTTY